MARFRRRRFGRKPVQRKKPLWVNRAFDVEPLNDAVIPASPGQFVDLYELLSWRDYTDMVFAATASRQETSLVLRTMGQVEIDVLASTAVSNAVQWSAAIVVLGEDNLIGLFADPAGPIPLVLNDNLTFADNLSRLNILQWKPSSGYGGAFLGAGAATYAPSVLGGQIPDSIVWRWDCKVKRKLKTDESLWLLVTGVVQVTEAEGFGAASHVESRTLFYDD